MLRITNLTDRDINISDSIKLKSRNYVDVQTTMDARLYHLANMNVIKIQEISNKTEINNPTISTGALRRQQTMERIRNGDIKPSVSLDVASYKQTNDTLKNKKSKKSK